ncbi:protein unc-13 homolog B-like [Polypterus senegalus]|uniref:protein unc-13 homolog B-like n=1 Tax=Polypterus senegalus TaxID=55291 RepID=UPI0019658F17|nr:protein unc-13 homolog B-like [Polypterus senegalus]
MSLLCVKVKRGRLHGPSDKFNTYVALKVQNLKSTTITRRGNEPLWEQDYMFEINELEKGLIVELWDKGLIWDTLIGTVWIPLKSIAYATEEGRGSWWVLDSDVLLDGGEICGTENPTLHEVLLDVYYEFPAEIPEDEAHFLIERLKSFAADDVSGQTLGLITAGSQSQVSDDNSQSSVLSQRPWDDTDGDRSLMPARDAYSSMYLVGQYDEGGGRRSIHLPPSETRKQDEEELAPNGRTDLESCSTCSLTPNSQFSLESRPILWLAESGSVESRPCSSVTMSPTSLPASYSDESGSGAGKGSAADLDNVSQSSGGSLRASSPSAVSDRDRSLCCSRSSSSCSFASNTQNKMNGDAQAAPSHGLPDGQQMDNEDIICVRSIARARWTKAIQKALQLPFSERRP